MGKQPINETAGNIRISEEVIATVASLEAAEVPGFVGMSNNFASGIYDLIGKKNPTKGIKAEIEGNQVSIDLFIVVEYGVRIPEVAFKIQEKVKKGVESMTGLQATRVNVHVQGISMEKDPKSAQPPTEEEKTEE